MPLQKDSGVNTEINPNEKQTQTEEPEQKQDNKEHLVGAYEPCTDHDIKRVHAGLLHLQKYAWLNFDHLYLENVALCSQQFFFKSSNYNVLLTFDTTKKCQLKFNVQYDGVEESEHVTGVNVYQNSGEEGYSIFRRNPSLQHGPEQYHDCADFYATPLYRMTLDKYNNMKEYAEKKQKMTERLEKNKK